MEKYREARNDDLVVINLEKRMIGYLQTLCCGFRKEMSFSKVYFVD
jgi:hypothetical protein